MRFSTPKAVVAKVAAKARIAKVIVAKAMVAKACHNQSTASTETAVSVASMGISSQNAARSNRSNRQMEPSRFPSKVVKAAGKAKVLALSTRVAAKVRFMRLTNCQKRNQNRRVE